MHSKIITNPATAAERLLSGKLVAFPTETVYGLGADHRDENALRNVFAIKGRPINHPLILHIASIDLLTNVAVKIPDIALELAEKYWPGPLTLILNKHPTINPLITGGQDTIAVRIPNHPQTQALLQHFPYGLVGPSANKFGQISPTTAQHVLDDLGQEPALSAVLEGGICNLGIESTIVDCSSKTLRILRPGALYLNIPNTIYNPSIRVSGALKSHYAPRAITVLADYQQIFSIISSTTHKVGVLSFALPPLKNNAFWITANAEPHKYAQELYSNLRKLDKYNPDYILIERTPENAHWQGINDRLLKASSKHSFASLTKEIFAHA